MGLLERRQSSGRLQFGFVSSSFFGLKNGQTLLKAWRRVLQQAGHARLFMIGGDANPEKMRRVLASEGLRNVECVGFISRKSDLLRYLAEEIDIVVHPSFTEGMSLSILEAMSLGIPVIGGSHSGGVPWLLDHGRAGLLTDIADHKRLASAMIKLGCDLDLRNTLAQNAVERAKEFEISRVCKNLCDLYAIICAVSDGCALH